jgi:flagellar export protein FliJ
MGFHFSLETVLRLRRSLEDGERLRLQTLLVDRAQLQTRISETIALHAALGTKLNTSLQQQTLSGGEMNFAVQRLRACDLQSARLNASLAALGQQIERQQALLLRRRIDRRVLEQLRERQMLRYEADTQRRTQSQVEELFLLRRARERVGASG